MATAFPHADRTASEARRPEAGSRAGGVSRAERGNDGSPSGARRRRRLDAPRARQRDRPCFLAGDAQPSRLDAQAHAPVIGKQVRQRLLWSGRSGAAGSAASRGAKHRAAGIARRAFPWRQAKRAAHQARRYRQRAQQKKVRRPRRNDAPKAARRDQFAAGAVIDCNWSITPGSTNTQACSAAIGTLNTCANTVRRRWARRPVRYACSGFMRPPACEPLRCGSHSTSATKPSSDSF